MLASLEQPNMYFKNFVEEGLKFVGFVNPSYVLFNTKQIS